MKGEVFKIGTGKQTSMIELARMIVELSGSNSDIKHVERRVGDLFALEADISKIKSKLGWEPKYTLSEGLKNTIEWYRKFIK